ncbi:MAG TPA: hypothetical protein VJ179_00265 [Patescibacteria group bacterium]|nr:hypothetical protein [Patescibacteria group bacterium]
MTSLQQVVLRTISYGDIFDYPVTRDEIHRFLIGSKASQKQTDEAVSSLLPQYIGCFDHLFFLQNREHIAFLRRRRETYAGPKRAIARAFARLAIRIPPVLCVGITGALSMNNTHKEDDIDLFVITRKNRLWTARLFLVTLAEMLYQRRRPGDVEVGNKLCLNMFLDEEALTMSQKNLYIAHEVYQMKPLAEKEGTYERFLRANQWASRFLPNWTQTERDWSNT